MTNLDLHGDGRSPESESLDIGESDDSSDLDVHVESVGEQWVGVEIDLLARIGRGVLRLCALSVVISRLMVLILA